jgi:hypothetical protein
MSLGAKGLTMHSPGQSGFDLWQGQKIFLFPKMYSPALEPT